MRVTLIAAGIAAVILLLRAFTEVIPAAQPMATMVSWALTASLAVASVGFAKEGFAGWCGLCAAFAVLFNPLLPAEIPANWRVLIETCSGAVCAASVIRHWK
ncbi:MAG: hypothetical protein EXS00_00220 [Phycisphaerales bacterium]|nr:hypothetical protein [Phycisphaerales bacterium]